MAVKQRRLQKLAQGIWQSLNPASEKKMKISIILAHPNLGSFNHAIASVAAGTLRSSGHDVILHDLCQEKFDAVYTAAELNRDAALPAEIQAHCNEIAVADGIIIVHPNWWGMPPAILKGWIDRVLRPEVAYRFVNGASVGLLKARSAVVFNTANTPADKEVALFGDPLDLIWKKCVFSLCGIKTVHRRAFTPVIISSPQQRQDWLEEVRTIVRCEYPPAN